MSAVLWVVAVILAVFGVVELLSGHILWGVLLIVLACPVRAVTKSDADAS